jgi:hypothetical protein
LAAEQMNVHQLVDNYKRLEKKLAELEAKLAEATNLAEDRVNHINALTEDLNVARDLNEHLFIENEKLEDDLEACRDFYEEHHDKGGFEKWLRIATHRCICFEDICTCEIEEEEDEDEDEYQEPDADDIAQMED